MFDDQHDCQAFVGSQCFALSATHPTGVSWAMFFCQDATDHCTLAGSADSPRFACRDHSIPPLLGSKHGLGSAVSGFLPVAQTALMSTSHVSLQV